MQLFLHILLNITMPIVLLALFGWFVQKQLNLSLETLKSLALNVILPCFFVHYLSTAELPLFAVWPVSWFTVLQFLVLLAIGWIIGRAAGLSAYVLPVFAIAIAFPNTGNYGVPLATLVFEPQYLLHQAIIVAIQTILIIVAGHILLAIDRTGLAGALKAVMLSPMIWGILIGLILRGFEWKLPASIAIPVEMIAICYAAIALLLLGASLEGSAHKLTGGVLQAMVWGKLVLAPALTWVLAWICGFTGEDLVFLVIASSTPVGVLLAIFCLDHRGEARDASAAVFLSTVLSPITITGWLLILRAYMN